MSRKRRRSCKRRKSSDTRENEHLPNICRCQKNTEDAENRAAEDQTETNIHEAKDIEQPGKNRSNHSCTVESREKKSADVLGSSKENIVSDSAKEGKQEKDCPSLAFSAQQDDLQSVVDTDESGTTSVGTITFRCSSDASDCLQSEDGLMAELKCGPFNVKVEVENNALLGIGADYAAKKCQCHKKRWYHTEQSCKWHKEPSPPSKCSGKYEIPSRCTVQIANKQNPSMKLSIVGKEIKIKYINRKQKLMVSIEPDKEPKKCVRTGSPKYKNKFVSDTDYSAPEASCHSDLESDFSFQEKEEAFRGYTNPEWCTFIPPPAEFADSEEISLESTTEVASLSPTDTFSVALNCGDNNDLHPGKDKKRMECANEKDFYKDIIFSEFSYTGESSEEDYGSKEKHFGKKPNDVMTDVHQARNSSLVDTRRIMLISHTESKNSRRYSFPATTIDILSSIHPRRDSGFYSMPSLSLKLLSKPAKATHTYSKGNHIPLSYTERSSSFTSLFGNFRDLRSSCCYAFTSCDHDITMYNAELEERNPIGNSFFMNHCLECMEDCREMDQVAVGNFQSIINSSGEQKEKNRSSEALSTLDVCREYTEHRKDGFHCEVLQNDPHEVQMYEELQNETQLNQVCSLSRSPSSSYAYHSNTYTKVGTESIQDQHSVAQPQGNLQLNIEESDSEVTKKKRRGSVMTVITGELERRLLIQGDSKNVADSIGLTIKKESMLPCSIRETFMSPLLDVEESDLDNDFQSFTEVQEMPEKFNGDSTCQDHSTQAAANSGSLEDEQILASTFFTEEPGTFSSEQDLCPSDDFGEHFTRDQMQELPKLNYENSEERSEINMELSQNPGRLLPENQTEQTEDPSMILPNEQTSSDARANDSSREEAVDHWARRRKQFKNSKRCGSTGGSSITSTITEGSINSEDGRSLDFSLHGESEEKGFYTEIFHSTSWVFRGDDASPDNSPRCLSKRPRPVAVRERTVRIAKGTGDYPWGFRIQFSKPILVTEVDTNSAAEEAGLQIGDIVLAVNGTDVTSVPHSEAANLARKGPDVLTLLVGSDISRCPNTPRPTCRGYLHKRTHSGILKGWRKRWFVLKHDGCLYYYKHKKDEGKCRPLEVTKLEGAEIGVDSSLGKPFVFKCAPQSGNRIFYFCATSNQEMKRWLEAMEKAVHPVHQNHVWVDVTMHNTSLPPLAIKNPECLGLLHHLDKNKDTWVQHYCILKDGCLYFYASIRSTHTIGGIYLQGYMVSEQSLGSRRSVIEVKPPSEEFETFYLCAESVNENKRWITALRASVSKWMPLNKAIQDFMNRPLEETRM